MFNSKERCPVVVISGGKKSTEVDFPSDKQWCELTSKKKSVKRQTGRGLGTWEDLGNQYKIDKEIFDSLNPTGDALDEFEASKAMEKLAKASIESSERVGDSDQVRITMSVFGKGNQVEHVMKMPTLADRVEHERESSSLDPQKRGLVLAVSLEPSGKLFDRLITSSSGYGEGSVVPIVHKAAALAELIAFCRKLEEEDEGE
jgi:hypothetical protein